MSEMEIPEGWSKKDFSQVSKSFDGLRIPLNKTERANMKGTFPYYGATGQVDSINDYKFDGRFLLITEDASLSNPINRKKPIAYIVEGKFWVNNHAHVVQTSEELDLDFLCYYINSLQIMDFAQNQGTRAKLNKTSLEKIPVIFPDILFQKKIVQKLNHVLGQLEEKKKQILSLIQQNKERIDFFEDNWVSFLIDSNIEKHPKKIEWELKTIDEIGDVKGGKRLPVGHSLLNEISEHPYLSIKDLKNNSVKEDQIKFLSDETWSKIKNYVISDDDVYFTIAGTIGEVGYIPKKWSGSNLTENAAKICNLDGITKDYLCYVLQSQTVQKQIKNNTSRVGVPKFALIKIRNLEIFVPDSIQTQNEIVKTIKHLEEKFEEQKIQFKNIKQNYELIIKYVNNIQYSILNSAFSGTNFLEFPN